MIFRERLIVLACTKTGENSLVLHCLTQDMGRRSFIVSVGRKSSMSTFLPLNVLDAEIIENKLSNLWRIRNIQMVHTLDGIRGNIGKNAITMFMSEVLFRSVHDGSGDERLFDSLEKNILTLDSLVGSFSNFHLRFLLEMAGALGFAADREALLPFCGKYAGKICDLLDADFTAFMLYPLRGEERNEIAGIFLKYLGYHCEAEINVRSLSVLRELFT